MLGGVDHPSLSKPHPLRLCASVRLRIHQTHAPLLSPNILFQDIARKSVDTVTSAS